ncbi:hypothetical protein HanIR_Chr01g0037021 [Helianthus annuus]|nr:hypothetical protein HanIR_Chr01g0037021 [Helianthus annuus]
MFIFKIFCKTWSPVAIRVPFRQKAVGKNWLAWTPPHTPFSLAFPPSPRFGEGSPHETKFDR